MQRKKVLDLFSFPYACIFFYDLLVHNSYASTPTFQNNIQFYFTWTAKNQFIIQIKLIIQELKMIKQSHI